MQSFSEPPGMEGDRLKEWKSNNKKLQDLARQEGDKLIAENPWLYDLLALYADKKDWGRDGPEYGTHYVKAGLRCIREGSQGLLFNPPLL